MQAMVSIYNILRNSRNVGGLYIFSFSNAVESQGMAIIYYYGLYLFPRKLRDTKFLTFKLFMFFFLIPLQSVPKQTDNPP